MAITKYTSYLIQMAKHIELGLTLDVCLKDSLKDYIKPNCSHIHGCVHY